MDEIYDLAIIGAGVMGLSAALIATTTHPRDRIAIFERNTVGAGASRYAPGIQINICRNEKEKALIDDSSQFWRRLYPEGRWPVGRDCDIFWLTRHPKELARLSSAGGTTPSTSSALRERLSSLPKFFIPSDTVVELDRGSYSPVEPIVQDLAQRLKGAGVYVYERTSIESVRQGPNSIVLQTSDTSVHLARRALLAIGPWLPDSPLAAHLTDRARSRVKKVVALHLAARPTPHCPMIGLFDDYAFLIPMIEEGYWLFSFTSQEWDVRPDSRQLRVSSDDLARATAILERWFACDMPAVASARVFCDCYSDDGVPFSRPAENVTGLHIVGGGAGNGFRFGPACAEAAITSLYSPYRP